MPQWAGQLETTPTRVRASGRIGGEILSPAEMEGAVPSQEAMALADLQGMALKRGML
jgi:hypothetical protein